MRILHFHPDGDKVISEYTALQCRVMGEYAEVEAVSDIKALAKHIRRKRPDIIHLHGCWDVHTAMAAHMARRKGIRTVLTPHGQLEPWIIKQNHLKEKLPRILLYQKSVVRRAYTVIVMGRMEEHHFRQLKWNPRVEIAHNSIITDTITAKEMCHTIYSIYSKVMYTDMLKLMNKETVDATAAVIKAGITGNHLWLTDNEYGQFRTPNNIEWDKLAVYAYHEGIENTVARGIETLGLPQPDIVPANIPYYLPEGFTATEPLSALISVKSGKDDNTNSNNGNDSHGRTTFVYADTQYFTEMIVQARKLASRKRLTISHIVEMAAELRTKPINEGKVAETLREKRLHKFAGRVMQLLRDMTGLEEGFMPVSPINDRQTNRIKTIINKHLEI